MVSRKLSPLFTLEELAVKVITSADRRVAAVSKLRRVRVESSKNTLAMVRPRNAGTLGTARELISAIWSAIAKIETMSSVLRSRVDKRCFIAIPLMQ